MSKYLNLENKIADENVISWDEYSLSLYQHNYKISQVTILVAIPFLLLSSLGYFLLMPPNRVSVYSMEINSVDNGNYLITKQSNIPAESFDLDLYTNNTAEN